MPITSCLIPLLSLLPAMNAEGHATEGLQPHSISTLKSSIIVTEPVVSL